MGKCLPDCECQEAEKNEDSKRNRNLFNLFESLGQPLFDEWPKEENGAHGHRKDYAHAKRSQFQEAEVEVEIPFGLDVFRCLSRIGRFSKACRENKGYDRQQVHHENAD